MNSLLINGILFRYDDLGKENGKLFLFGGYFIIFGGMIVGAMSIASSSMVEKHKTLAQRGEQTNAQVVRKYRKAIQTQRQKSEDRNIASAEYEYYLDFSFVTDSGKTVTGSSFAYGVEKWDLVEEGGLVPVTYDPLDHTNYVLDTADVELAQATKSHLKSTSIGMVVTGVVMILISLGLNIYTTRPSETIAAGWVHNQAKIFRVDEAKDLVDLFTGRRKVLFYVEYPPGYQGKQTEPNGEQYVDKALATKLVKGQMIDVLHPPGDVEKAQIDLADN